MALLTSRTLATGVTGTDLIHIVITGDTSQNPAGSSYKAEIDQVKNYLSNYFISSTGNTSASCITDLYVTNVYGCSPITIHDSVQSVGSSSTGNTSFAFGGGVSAFGDYSHSEGLFTTSLGVASHTEGVSTYAGLYGYNSTSIVSGVITLDSSYGDVTNQFNSFIILDDFNFDGNYNVQVFYINSITFDGTNTIITLTDASVNTTQAHIGSDYNIIPTSSDVYVGGHNSHSEGDSNVSVSIRSHTEGFSNFSYGTYSHSEGVQTKSFGEGSHSEGNNTVSTGNGSHSEGYSTESIGEYSHSEGRNTISNGTSSHSEGFNTRALSNYSHSEGINTQTASEGSHSEGSGTTTNADASHSEGLTTSSDGVGSHSEGKSTISIGLASHSEGIGTSTGQFGYYSNSIVSGVVTLGAWYGDVTGQFISPYIIIDDYNFDNNFGVTLLTIQSILFNGTNTVITLDKNFYATTQAFIGVPGVYQPLNSGDYLGGNFSHSEGSYSFSVGTGSHSEGEGTSSIGNSSHSEGAGTQAVGDYSHSEGENTKSIGDYSHSEGGYSQSIGDYSHSEGCSTSTGQYGYLGTMVRGPRFITILLDGSYGDVSSQFIGNLILDDNNFSATYGIILTSILSSSFTTRTEIILNDQTIFTPTAIFGVFGVANPPNANYPIGGSCSHSEGSGSMAVGSFSHSQGSDTISFGDASFASGVQSHAIGTHSFIHSNNSQVYGNRSVVLGGQNITGTTDDTVYVPYLNIGNLATGTSVNNLGIDSQGNVVVGGGSSSLTPPVTISGVGMTVLTLIGSGTTVPVFSVQGSSGELFSVTDSLTGSLFSVNDISGLPVLEAFSDSTILMGDYLSPSLNTTKKVTASSGTSTTIYSIPVSAYTGAFFDYTVGSGTNFRSGNIMVIWDGPTAQYTDTYSGGTSPEIGLTSDITFSVSISVGGTADLVATTVSNSWDVKVIVRSI